MARKFIELKAGCMSKAFPDEPTFVLLGRDVCAPMVIRAWIEARIITGKNNREDHQITEARRMALMMEREQVEWSKLAHAPADDPPPYPDVELTEEEAKQDVDETAPERP
jgi:hypothetical protein